MKMSMVCVMALGLVMGVASHRPLAAAEDEEKPDFEAEKKQIAQEEADEQAMREKGDRVMRQIRFSGKVRLLTEPDEKLMPGVVGYFLTNSGDRKPNRSYQILLDEKDKGNEDMFKGMDGKMYIVRGRLRLLDGQGNGKYLIIESAESTAPTPKTPGRVMPGGV